MSGNPDTHRWWRDPLGRPPWMPAGKPRQMKPRVAIPLALFGLLLMLVSTAFWAMLVFVGRLPWPFLGVAVFTAALAIFFASRLPSLFRKASAGRRVGP